MIKPPLGLKPRLIHLIHRRIAITQAISRYNEAGYPIPKEWIDELYILKDYEVKP